MIRVTSLSGAKCGRWVGGGWKALRLEAIGRLNTCQVPYLSRAILGILVTWRRSEASTRTRVSTCDKFEKYDTFETVRGESETCILGIILNH